MIIKHTTIEVTREIYNRILEEFNGRSYGKHNGLSIVLYRNIKGKYFIESADHVERITP